MRRMNPPKPFYKEIIVAPEDIEPSSDSMNVVGAFNPGAAEIDVGGVKKTVLMMRVAEMPAEEPRGYVSLPFFPVENGPDSPFKIEFDTVSRKQWRVTRKDATSRRSGLTRLRHISYFKKASLKKTGSGGLKIDSIEDGSCFFPQYEHERFGIEDSRITKIEDKYVMSYVSPHRTHGVSTSFAVTDNFKEFERLSYMETPMPIFRDKDVSLFGSKLPIVSGPRGKGRRELEYAAFTRPSSFPGISKPHMCISFSPDLVHWGPHIEISENGSARKGGPSAPGIALEKDGIWLVVYHEITQHARINTYRTMISGFDLNEPWKLKYGPKFLFGPGEFDIGPGFTEAAVYTTGMLVSDGIADMLSGEKDCGISYRGFYQEDLIKYVKS